MRWATSVESTFGWNLTAQANLDEYRHSYEGKAGGKTLFIFFKLGYFNVTSRSFSVKLPVLS